ncbi:MAG TPA: hypothetical protein VHM31_20000 [Polyangia bacterium]|nr:hypothetical protein [Polyangia bacterium]
MTAVAVNADRVVSLAGVEPDFAPQPNMKKTNVATTGRVFVMSSLFSRAPVARVKGRNEKTVVPGSREMSFISHLEALTPLPTFMCAEVACPVPVPRFRCGRPV